MLNILLVEDNVDVANALSEVLADQCGAVVRRADCGQSASHELRCGALDLAVIDVMLPDTSGFEVAQLAANREVPALLMSGHPRGQLACEVFGYPHLHKPFSLKAFLDAATNTIRDPGANIANLHDSYMRLRTLLPTPGPTVDREGRLVTEGMRLQAQLLSTRWFDRALVAPEMRQARNGERRAPVAHRLVAIETAAVLTRSLDGRIISWSPEMRERYGYTDAQAVGRLSHELLRTVFCQPRDDIGTVLEDEREWSGALLHRRTDGRPLMTANHWRLDYDSDWRGSLVTEFHSDVVLAGTDVGRELAEIMGSIALDLSQPLTAIRSYTLGAQLELQQSAPDPARLVQAMEKAGDQLTRTSEILSLMRQVAESLQHAE